MARNEGANNCWSQPRRSVPAKVRKISCFYLEIICVKYSCFECVNISNLLSFYTLCYNLKMNVYVDLKFLAVECLLKVFNALSIGSVANLSHFLIPNMYQNFSTVILGYLVTNIP